MTNQKVVGWIRPVAVTHQDKPAGQNEWAVLPMMRVIDVDPRLDKSAIFNELNTSDSLLNRTNSSDLV